MVNVCEGSLKFVSFAPGLSAPLRMSSPPSISDTTYPAPSYVDSTGTMATYCLKSASGETLPGEEILLRWSQGYQIEVEGGSVVDFDEGGSVSVYVCSIKIMTKI